MLRYYFVSGDLGLPVDFQATDGAGNPLNLTGAGTPLFNLDKRSDGSEILTDRTATIVDAATGKLRYSWSVGETTNLVGEYLGQFRVTLAGGAEQSFPSDDYLYLFFKPRL